MGNELQADQSSLGEGHNSAGGVSFRLVAVLILLFAVAALSTLAKDGLYFSRTSIERHTSYSTKMVPTHAVAVFFHEGQVVAKTRPLPPVRDPLPIPSVIAHVRPIGVVVSMQHRSPPLFSIL
jgi:hypothetical protein